MNKGRGDEGFKRVAACHLLPARIACQFFYRICRSLLRFRGVSWNKRSDPKSSKLSLKCFIRVRPLASHFREKISHGEINFLNRANEIQFLNSFSRGWMCNIVQSGSIRNPLGIMWLIIIRENLIDIPQRIPEKFASWFTHPQLLQSPSSNNDLTKCNLVGLSCWLSQCCCSRSSRRRRKRS